MLQIKISDIKYMESFAHADPTIVSLSQGSLKIGGVPQEIRAYAQDILNTDKADYYANYQGIPALREKIALELSRKNNTQINPDQILITHGSSGAIATLLLTILQPGDEVLLPEPTYPAYSKLAQTCKAKTVFVSCAVPKNANDFDWEINIEKIKANTTEKTKVIIIANPSNPTGQAIPQKTLLELANWCSEKGIYLISDEVYDDYIFEGEYTSVTPYINESPYIIRCGSFSKNFSMSGWRIGYAVMTKELIKYISAVQDTLIVCPSVIGQYAALYAIQHPELTKQIKTDLQNNRTLTTTMLQPLKDKGLISFNEPKAAFYLFLKTQSENSSELCLDMMQKSKVVTVPGSAFGPSGKQFIRLCFARQQNVLKEGLERIVDYFNNHWSY